MSWRERLAAHCAPGREPGECRFRLPDDLDALVADWHELRAAVWLLREDCRAMGGTTWSATPTAKATRKWEE